MNRRAMILAALTPKPDTHVVTLSELERRIAMLEQAVRAWNETSHSDYLSSDDPAPAEVAWKVDFERRLKALEGK